MDATQDRSNRLSVTRAGGQLITDYWDDLFTAREQGKQIVWYNGGALNPFFQAADLAWCHGEAFAARLAAQRLEGPAQLADAEYGYHAELCSYARTHLGCSVLTLQSSQGERSGVVGMPSLALRGTRDLEVSSMCATFAETEIVSLLAQGLPAADIASSVHRAIAARTLALVAQVGKRTPVVLTGGVARNRAAVRFLAEALNLEVQVPARPQITGAYGVALLAIESAGRAQDQGDADVSVPLFPGSDRSCTDCDGTVGSTVGASVVELGPDIADVHPEAAAAPDNTPTLVGLAGVIRCSCLTA